MLLVATRWCIMRLFVRPMAMRLLHGFKEAPPMPDRVIRSLHPRPTEWDLNNEIEFQNKKKKRIPRSMLDSNHVPGICDAASPG